MSRPKGTPKTGGRTKGTPNKTTKEVKEWLNVLLDGGRGRFEQALLNLSAEDYVKTYMGLLNYVAPKMQAVSLQASLAAEYSNLEKLLDKAPDKVIDAIADKILEMQRRSKDEQQELS